MHRCTTAHQDATPQSEGSRYPLEITTAWCISIDPEHPAALASAPHEVSMYEPKAVSRHSGLDGDRTDLLHESEGLGVDLPVSIQVIHVLWNVLDLPRQARVGKICQLHQHYSISRQS